MNWITFSPGMHLMGGNWQGYYHHTDNLNTGYTIEWGVFRPANKYLLSSRYLESLWPGGVTGLWNRCNCTVTTLIQTHSTERKSGQPSTIRRNIPVDQCNCIRASMIYNAFWDREKCLWTDVLCFKLLLETDMWIRSKVSHRNAQIYTHWYTDGRVYQWFLAARQQEECRSQ